MKTMVMCFLVLICSSAFGQNSDQKELKDEFHQLQTELNGFYQIWMINTRQKPAISIYHLRQIKSRQKKDTVVFWDVSDSMRIKITPELSPQNSEYKNLDYVLYLSE